MSEGHFCDRSCPRCGSTLLLNAEGRYWCSFVGGGGQRPCTFGLDGIPVTLDVLNAVDVIHSDDPPELPLSLCDPLAILDRRLASIRGAAVDLYAACVAVKDWANLHHDSGHDAMLQPGSRLFEMILAAIDKADGIGAKT